MTPAAWINGQLVEAGAASVSVRDSGLLHGAGVFTTMRASGGKVIRLSQHLSRLRGSCKALEIGLPYDDDQLTAAAAQLLPAQNLSDARLRLTVTRGVLEGSPVLGSSTRPTVILTASPFQPYPQRLYQRGMSVSIVEDQRLNPLDIQAGHKTLNYLSRLAALKSASHHGCGEALWMNAQGFIESGSISNVFVIRDGKLLTPPTRAELLEPPSPPPPADAPAQNAVPYRASAVLPGITRQLVLELAAAAGIATARCAVDRQMLRNAEGCFLTSSLMGIMPVTRVGENPMGRSGVNELTVLLMRMYDKATVG